MKPTVEKLIEKYNTPDSGVEIVSIDVELEENKDIAVEYGVRSIPTLVFEKNGETIERLTGAKTFEAIDALIEVHI